MENKQKILTIEEYFQAIEDGKQLQFFDYDKTWKNSIVSHKHTCDEINEEFFRLFDYRIAADDA